MGTGHRSEQTSPAWQPTFLWLEKSQLKNY
nr:MAG TPA: hypothetical protein [Caudoviricetes sp.]